MVRKRLWIAALHYLWPLLRSLARLYRFLILRHPCLVVVVGSFGKTTTARAVSAALEGGVRETNSYNFKGGVALTVLKTLPWRRFVVIEATIDGPGQMIQYARMIRPEIAVVTCIGSEHHRSLGSLENTRNEKFKILAGMSPQQVAVLNGDDPNVRWMASQTEARVITFGFGEMNDVRASEMILDWPRGTRLKVHANGKTQDMFIRLFGRHMVYPILASIAVALSKGFSLDQILPPLQELSPTPGRLDPVRLSNGAIILRDDFKSSLETVHSALDLFSKIPAKRRMVVLGEVSEPPGSQGPIYREIGERIARIASRVIFIGVNFQRYAAGARKGGMAKQALTDAGEGVINVINILREELTEGDVVLVKGRDTQRLDRITLALSGREVKCHIKFCNIRPFRCDQCPMLEQNMKSLT